MLGYGFAVDWWSLGVLAWETLSGSRPFAVHASTTHREALALLGVRPEPQPRWSRGFRELVDRLLAVEPLQRCSSLKELRQLTALSRLNLDAVLAKRVKPAFTPPKDHLNCDPTFELEEMIVETKPLHKKKKRLAKQRLAGVASFIVAYFYGTLYCFLYIRGKRASFFYETIDKWNGWH